MILNYQLKIHYTLEGMFQTHYKKTLVDQIKYIYDKIKENQVQYNLDREAAKVFALSSGKLENYEYLTGEELG